VDEILMRANCVHRHFC